MLTPFPPPACCHPRTEYTNELILWFSVLSTIVVCSVSVTQVYLLRRFFKSKKLM